MLILIITVIMCGVKVDSCDSLCECNKIPEQSICEFSQQLDKLTNHCTLNLDQQHLVTMLGNESYVNFPDSFTVEIKTCEVHLNFSELNLHWIKNLILSDNNLTAVSDFIPEFTGMNSLDLSQNKIEFIDAQLFRTLHLKKINLSSNEIYQINTSSLFYLKELSNLDLSNNHLTSIQNLLPLPSLQYLNLSNNNIKVLDGAGFNCLNLLQHLDVSRNRLVRIASESIHLPSLTRLFVAGNTQLGKSRDVFIFVGTGRKLQTLDASRTGLKQVPAALTQSIQFLKLNENLIQMINCGDLDSFPLLLSLDLTFNYINFLEDDSLGRLEFLSILYLSKNQLIEIPKRLPEKLKVLYMDFNKISIMRKNDLEGFSALEVLLLNDNNITVINEGAFSELISLVTLDLSRNPLINLQSGVFVGPLSLEILHLSSVAIISTNEDNPFPLSAPERLVTLDLSYSPGLAQQFLSDTATLMAAKRLQELDLSGGNLEYLRQDLQFFLPQLNLLRITGNKLNSTQTGWLKAWLCAEKRNKELLNNVVPKNDNYKSKTLRIIKSELNTRNSNEVNKFDGVMPKFSHNLFFPYNKNSLGSQEQNNELVRSSLDEQAVDKREDSIKWNVSNVEISMYTSEKKNYFYRSLFLVLSTALIVFTFSVLLILRLIRIRQPYIEDIEATTLPTISDIW